MVVSLTEGQGGLAKLVIRNAEGASAEIYTYGAHVSSWKNKEGEELLFVSEEAIYKPPKAIRGGIPVCFPQFSDCGPCSQQHGFARNSTWEVVNGASEAASEVSLRLCSTEETRQMFPFDFDVTYTVGLSDNGNLVMKTKISNPGSEAMPLSYALHTYFATPDITLVKVGGLQGVKYLDSLQQRQTFTENNQEVNFPGEVDRIYLGVPDKLKLEVSKTRSIMLATSGFPDAVVWNPWIEKAKAMGDFGDEEYKKMFCVEVLLLKQNEENVLILPGSELFCVQELSVM